ncbi:hypothetical protein [Labrys monachus]|uniref:Uncharacterized protein n=1 Tax=Labrys monachus TaxID=217067 RepID=A0ABU0FC49_9HYPH|nr:hypothetical protein [Labrys monachus]MDQ0392194.1 hypothetical protein [Labrys monachus]
MSDWKIVYSERPLGVAVHGVISILDEYDQVVESFEGLATDANGHVKPIGSQKLGDTIQGHFYPGRSANAESQPKIVYVGSKPAIVSAMIAMEDATVAINLKNIPYQLPLIDSGFNAPTNSNSYIATMFSVLGLRAPTPLYDTAAGQVGRGMLLLSPEEIAGFHAGIGGTVAAGQQESHGNSSAEPVLSGAIPHPPPRPNLEIDRAKSRRNEEQAGTESPVTFTGWWGRQNSRSTGSPSDIVALPSEFVTRQSPASGDGADRYFSASGDPTNGSGRLPSPGGMNHSPNPSYFPQSISGFSELKLDGFRTDDDIQGNFPDINYVNGLNFHSLLVAPVDIGTQSLPSGNGVGNKNR